MTDNSAQFLQPDFEGHQFVTVLPTPDAIPQKRQGALRPGDASGKVHLPTIKDFEQGIARLKDVTRDILVLTSAHSLSPTFDQASQAADELAGTFNIQVVDSCTTSAGLGWLVQRAARMASQGAKLYEIERSSRSATAQVYTLLCIPELTYLARNGYLTSEQARVGEMMGMVPIFTLEGGQLNPLTKARASRQLVEVFLEFLAEFSNPQQVIFLRSIGGHAARPRALRDFVSENFPRLELTEIPVNLSVAQMIGPQSTGLIVIENTGKAS